ncbi:PKD domain-containing protein [Candidatus Leptofilum sp.]|uniref:PKD domain-containing protein n=1 Tax=Candidatus Leptofilum sp. TaxID=3241576 RepID=UPI003B5CF0AB
MKKAAFIFFFFVFAVGGILLTKPSSNLEAAQDGLAGPPTFTPPTKGLYTNRDARYGRLSTNYQAILGPDSCIHLGDPYSPLSSPFSQGPYTYTYAIRIPASYPHDIVRVELFDPDSINSDINDPLVLRTDIAVSNGLGATDLKSCGTNGGSSDRTSPCALDTDERTLVTGAPNLDFDQINPHWFVRVDTNWSPPIAPSGNCGTPTNYTASLNAQTLFDLYYFAQTNDETPTRIPLVVYIGQTDDGLRDNGDHNTDLRWVSPGADNPFSPVDTPGNAVPAIAQTTDSFEVDLTADVPGITTDTLTGDRYLYLDVRTISGASENGFDIWAGPPIYTDGDSGEPDVPSEVNVRNLYILNNPGTHDAAGVEILALGTLPQTSIADYPIEMPLLTVGPELAGQTLQVRLFDNDDGAQPPLIFYFDTIAFTPDDANPLGYDPANTDWAMAFGVSGQDDPDGVAEGVRCLPGSCPTQWVDPAYNITVPGNLDNCDYDNPTMEDCTPFYGGRLMVRFNRGVNNLHTWEMSIPQEPNPDPLNPTLGCAAFPITIHEGARSVTAPGTGSNPYPNAGDFTYPATPPSYGSFLDHQDDVPLLDATPGDIFRAQNGFGDGNFAWLVWNEGIPASSSTLANSLTWPGDSTNYNACTGGPDGCVPGSGVPGSGLPNVPGYIEPGDPTDQALHIGDWIAASTGSINSSFVREPIESHIDLGRTLRLPIWGSSDGTGANGRYQTSQFAIFRLIGYNLDASSWLLLEFVGLDTSCGQLSAAPTAVSITGPANGETNISYNFTADISPSFTSTPITYTWEISGQNTITNTDGISNTVSLSWDSVGSKDVTVTAVNETGFSVIQSHTIDIALPEQKIYLPIINKN